MLQSIVVLALIALAGLYLGVKLYRTARSARHPAGSGCGSDCGCAGSDSDPTTAGSHR